MLAVAMGASSISPPLSRVCAGRLAGSIGGVSVCTRQSVHTSRTRVRVRVIERHTAKRLFPWVQGPTCPFGQSISGPGESKGAAESFFLSAAPFLLKSANDWPLSADSEILGRPGDTGAETPTAMATPLPAQAYAHADGEGAIARTNGSNPHGRPRPTRATHATVEARP